METIWGLDLGTTSIGFSVVRMDIKKEQGEIIKTGVRIFPEGLNNDHEPRNKRRRDMRLHRRQLRRRRIRRIELSRKFKEMDLLPEFSSDCWNKLMEQDPYVLRNKGVSERLELHQFGRAIYHLVQRRGFLSNRRSTGSEEGKEEEGIVKSALQDLDQELGESTLGQYLSEQEIKRGRYLDRNRVIEEFKRLWQCQRAYHAEILTEKIEKELYEFIFHQRPVFWRISTLGNCRLLPDSRLCLKGSWLGQQYLLFQELNSLRLDGSNEPLPNEERQQLIDALLDEGELSWAACRKILKTSWQKRGIPLKTKFNLEFGGKSKLAGNRVVSSIRSVLKENSIEVKEIEKLYQLLPQWHFEILYKEVGEGRNARIVMRNNQEIEQKERFFVNQLMSEIKLEEKIAKKLVSLDFPAGWLSHSTDAIERLMPYLEQGFVYSDACDRAFPSHRVVEGEGLEFLPSDQSYLKEVRNPTVKRALNELRKVVNNLIRTYGKPDRIRVELARELKLPSTKRRDYQKKTKQRENERTQARDAIRKANFRGNSLEIEKYLLWKESDEKCLYTNQSISFSALFEEGKYEIEHILPYSVTLDNGFMNKTLCETNFNGFKSNRIPFEAFKNSGGEEEWKKFVERVKKSKLPDPKKRRLLAQKIEDLVGDDPAERQLRDTAFIAREARDFLMKLFTKKEDKAIPVETSNGMITAQLRQLWGMNQLLAEGDKKNRDDHRHHAVDAVVVAMVHPGTVRHMSFLSKNWLRGERTQFPAPWQNFYQDAQKSIESIIVSHKVRSKVNGKLHDELVYGKRKDQTGSKKGSSVYKRRVHLQSLSKSQLQKLKDGTLEAAWDGGGNVQQILRNHLEHNKDFSTLPFFNLEHGEKRFIKSISLLYNKKDHLVEDLHGKQSTFVDKNENHHVAVYENGDGEIRFEVISRMDAAKNLSQLGSPVIREIRGGFRFKFSLVINDAVISYDEENRPNVLIVQSIWDSGNVVFRDHRDAGNKDRGINKSISTLISEGWEKCAVDPIGRLAKKND
ncbi:MAG: type II CRISPR RNA-guided endonuclease Cas9 [Proteobacteria bacterium]|nr:type II CRISPR RNA-guided endonuclease Cas9 [Pseudomonadota bacterium]